MSRIARLLNLKKFHVGFDEPRLVRGLFFLGLISRFGWGRIGVGLRVYGQALGRRVAISLF